jgi:hypothetical protein
VIFLSFKQLPAQKNRNFWRFFWIRLKDQFRLATPDFDTNFKSQLLQSGNKILKILTKLVHSTASSFQMMTWIALSINFLSAIFSAEFRLDFSCKSFFYKSLLCIMIRGWVYWLKWSVHVFPLPELHNHLEYPSQTWYGGWYWGAWGPRHLLPTRECPQISLRSFSVMFASFWMET